MMKNISSAYIAVYKSTYAQSSTRISQI